MPPRITELAFRVALVTETLTNHPDWLGHLANFGLTKARISEGGDALVDAFEKMEKVGEHPDDHTGIEQAKRAVTELGSWLETYTGIWMRAAGDAIDEASWKQMTGHKLLGHDAEFVVLMRAWRLISSLRTNEEAMEALLAVRPRIGDDLQRGNMRLYKSFKLMHKRYHLRGEERRHGVSQADLEQVAAKLLDWLLEVADAASKAFAADVFNLGLMGLVPENVGAHLGGMGRDIILHDRAVGPRPTNTAERCEQWGIGAPGNKENYW